MSPSSESEQIAIAEQRQEISRKLGHAVLIQQGAPTEGGSAPSAGVFSGEIALVTGGASGIGKAIVESLFERGAAVINMDINPAVEGLMDSPRYLGIQIDLTDESALDSALRRWLIPLADWICWR